MPSWPKLRRRGGAESQPTAPTRPAPATGAKPGEAGSPATSSPTGEPLAEPASPASLDGLRAWVAELDRKLGTRFYALAAASVLALATAIVGLVLVLGLKDDAATKADLGDLRQEVAGVEESATDAVQDDVAQLSERIDQIESQVQGLRSSQNSGDRELSVVQDDIADLRDEISDLRSRSDAAGNDSP